MLREGGGAGYGSLKKQDAYKLRMPFQTNANRLTFSCFLSLAASDKGQSCQLE